MDDGMFSISVILWTPHINTNNPHQHSSEYEETTVSSNDTTCTGRKRRGWPGGRHASPTELKMRSRITTFSVNFSAFPANQSLQLLAKSVRPRAKSFIRPISQMAQTAKKCSLDDVRGQEMPQIGKKWPKFGFFARGRRTRGRNLLQCINEMCARIRRFEFACTEWRSMTTSPSFLRNNDFFSKVDISFEK